MPGFATFPLNKNKYYCYFKQQRTQILLSQISLPDFFHQHFPVNGFSAESKISSIIEFAYANLSAILDFFIVPVRLIKCILSMSSPFGPNFLPSPNRIILLAISEPKWLK